ncbi:MAG: hypothetical protein KF832_04080 [Caldilineaceae bacterium]|nr:hypothetical protein [Caldilineaceae bacterium]
MIQLFDARSGAPIGTVTEPQLTFMRAQLEEESADDQDYYINRATLELFESRGAEPALVALLRQALGSRDDMDIRWESV